MGFSKRSKKEFNNWWKELVESSFENINKKDKSGKTILHYAVRDSGQKTVKLLIEKGADVNVADVGGYVPIHLAVIGEQLKNVKELISAGAKVNIAEYNGLDTPLHLACMVGKVEIVKELVKAGAEIGQLNKLGETAMDCVRNNKEITEVLENSVIANKQKEFIEKVKSVSEKATAGVIAVKEDLIVD